MSKVTDTKSFIRKAKLVHAGYYSYNKASYIDSYSQITVTCKKHGDFSQKANNHLMGKGCRQCAIEARPEYKTVKKADILRSGLELISEVGSTIYHRELVSVRCKVHGQLKVKANSAVNGCHRCARLRSVEAHYTNLRTSKLQALIVDLVKLYGDQYDVSSAKYIDAKTALQVVCKDHGKFMASPNRLTCGKLKGKIKTIPCKQCRATGKYKIVTIKGKTFEYRGYEDRALRFLIEERGVKPDDIVVGTKVPRIQLDLKYGKGKLKVRHFPDIYIKSRNMLVEVKSQATFGFTAFYGDNDTRIRTIQHKSLKAKEAGFDYRVMLFIKRSRTGIVRQPLPTGWDTMPIKDLKAWFKTL